MKAKYRAKPSPFGVKMNYQLFRWALGNWMSEPEGERGEWREMLTEEQRWLVDFLDMRGAEVERMAMNILSAIAYERFCDASTAPDGGDLPFWWY